ASPGLDRSRRGERDRTISDWQTAGRHDWSFTGTIHRNGTGSDTASVTGSVTDDDTENDHEGRSTAQSLVPPSPPGSAGAAVPTRRDEDSCARALLPRAVAEQEDGVVVDEGDGVTDDRQKEGKCQSRCRAEHDAGHARYPGDRGGGPGGSDLADGGV